MGEYRQLNLIRELVVACNDMADKWSEYDDAGKRGLWQRMTTALRNYCEAFGWPAQWVDYNEARYQEAYFSKGESE